MNNLFTKFRALFLDNKRILIPLVPLILFVVFFIVIMFASVFSPQPPIQETQNFPTPTHRNNQPSSQPPILDEDSDTPLHGSKTLYENSTNLEKKETLPDGSTKYSLTTTIPNRPDIIHTTGVEQNIIFERSVIEHSISLSEYLELFGQPERIISGSKFYGANAQTYILSTEGFAYIANPQTNRVLELHTFAPMSVDEYIRNFGEDIITPTPAL